MLYAKMMIQTRTMVKFVDESGVLCMFMKNRIHHIDSEEHDFDRVDGNGFIKYAPRLTQNFVEDSQ